MLSDFLVIIAGVLLVVGLAEVVIRNAVALAQRYSLSGSIVGLTVLSVGTSIPEVATNVAGSMKILENPEKLGTISGLMIGTSIGSDIFQQNIVVPVVALVGTILIRREHLWTDMGAMVGAAGLVWVFGFGGLISRLEGAVLVLAYGGYLAVLARTERRLEPWEKEERGRPSRRPLLALLAILACFVVMGVVTERVVDASARLVELLPISASFFGVIVLGLASAMPELATSLLSIAKDEKGISAGILIGSNITNPLFAIGLGALISTYAVPEVVVYYDLPVNIATAGLLLVFMLTSEELKKGEAIALILAFLAYLTVRNIVFPTDF